MHRVVFLAMVVLVYPIAHAETGNHLLLQKTGPEPHADRFLLRRRLVECCIHWRVRRQCGRFRDAHRVVSQNV